MKSTLPVAIVGWSSWGLAGDTEDALWSVLEDGVELLGQTSAASPGWIDVPEIDPRPRLFDPEFFDLSPRDAELLEPQQRMALELCWEALEDAGYSILQRGPEVGVYLGGTFSSYLTLQADDSLTDVLPELLGADREYLATRVAHHLKLRGPALNVQTACSTGLVAVHLACQALRSGECRAALAGGLNIAPQLRRNFYAPGAILSPDGRCRAFDASADGTVFRRGAAVLVLMRLADALAGGHPVRAVIRATAISNDGGGKASFMAPSIAGQARTIRAALQQAGISATSIGYMEGHGTGTVIGDSIELSALTQVHREHSDEVGYCRLGSIKANIGHTAGAAGTFGVLRAAMALEREIIPPNAALTAPNPDFNPTTSPFVLDAGAAPWPRSSHPRFAAVSSFGVGGTNAHAVLEEPPIRRPSVRRRRSHLVLVSGKSPAALDDATRGFAERVSTCNPAELGDISFTSSVGRAAQTYRRAAVGADGEMLQTALARQIGQSVSPQPSWEPTLAFLFPGQGAQRLGMGAALYSEEREFRRHVDDCLAAALRLTGLDLSALFRRTSRGDTGSLLEQTRFVQPALFILEYALGRLLMEWGLRPASGLGHSIGEFALAALAGVLSLDDAVRLVVRRGELMQGLPAGAMTSVALSEEELRERLPANLDVAAINAARQCVVAGSLEAMASFEAKLRSDSVPNLRLKTSHAFHSRMMDAVLQPFAEELKSVTFGSQGFEIVSSVTGELISAQVRDPAYWLMQIREPVRFESAAAGLAQRRANIWIEVGPGEQLTGLARQNGIAQAGVYLAPLLGGRRGAADETSAFWSAMGELWTRGASLDWDAVFTGQRRRVTRVPKTSFQRRSFREDPADRRHTRRPVKREVPAWCYAMAWRETHIAPGPPPAGGRWVVADADPEQRLAQAFEAQQIDVVRCAVAGSYRWIAGWGAELDLRHRDQVAAFCADLAAEGVDVDRLVFAPRQSAEGGAGALIEEVVLPLTNLVSELSALGPRGGLSLDLVLTNAMRVLGDERLQVEYAALRPLAIVLAQETGIQTRVLDIGPSDSDLCDAAVCDALMGRTAATLARRGRRWWTPQAAALPEVAPSETLTLGGAYLIMGGLGMVGMSFATHLASRWKARLIIVGRTPLGGAGDLQARGDPQSKLRMLSELGAQVEYLVCDLEDAAQVAALANRLAGVGLDGMIFCSGRVDVGAKVLSVDLEAYHANLRAKARAFETARKGLRGVMARHRLLVSSISTVLGGLEHGPYACANAAAEALALDPGEGPSWRVVNWDLLADTAKRQARASYRTEALAMTASESGEALERVLSFPDIEQIIVSTYDLDVRLAQWSERRPVPSIQTAALGVRAEGSVTPLQGEVEEALGRVWQDILGVAQVGREDNFFDLGGHSLLAIETCLQMQPLLGEGIGDIDLYATPTIAGIVAACISPETAMNDPALPV